MSDAKYLAGLRGAAKASETARLNADRSNERSCGPTERLETYEEAWARLSLPGTPNVPAIIANGVVRQKVRKDA